MTDQKGQALLYVTLSLVAVLGMLALVVDLGLLYYYKSAAQAAADAAALAAAAAFNQDPAAGRCPQSCTVAFDGVNSCASPSSVYLKYGCAYANTHGFSGSSVKIGSDRDSVPATIPEMKKVQYWAVVSISRNYPPLFSAILGSNGSMVTARATAVVRASSGSPGTCIYALSPTGTGLKLSGTADLNGCGIVVNSTDFTDAISRSGSGDISAGPISTVGGFDISGSGTITATALRVNGKFEPSGSVEITPSSPTKDATAVADPFADLPSPAFNSSCDSDHINKSISGSKDVTLNPGVYCGGIKISGSGTITFEPGLYILNGGGFDVSGSVDLVGTRGVSFYNTASPGYRADGIQISGSGNIQFTAMSTGDLSGVVFFQDRSVTAAAKVSGSKDMQINGTLYFPTASVSYSGSGRLDTPFTVLVAYTLDVTGSKDFSMKPFSMKPDPTGEHTGFAKAVVALVQ